MSYRKRFVDEVLLSRLKGVGAVLLDGVKGCGKTETALQAAASSVRFDADNQVKTLIDINPALVLEGATPRLIDEWQEYPKIWNYIRREVDERKLKGQFILTGSATPNDDVKRHSGVGRFSVIKMRTMSFYESGWSSGEVSLASLMEKESPTSGQVDFDLLDLSKKIAIGGWPGLIGLEVDQAYEFIRDYLTLVSEVDVNNVLGKRRDPLRVRRLLESFARNISTEATTKVLATDALNNSDALDKETVSDYISALERLMVIESLPAWNTHLRSADRLRKAPKRHFVDPSLALGALGITADRLVQDLNYLGLVFESLVIRDLRIYAEAKRGKVFHYRDSRNLEVDAIVEMPDGTWGAFEVKLGIGALDEAAKTLLTFADKIDTDKTQAPTALTVITGNGFAYRRPDGVNVVPISTLTM